MKMQTLRAILISGFLFCAVPSASADSKVTYPDGSIHQSLNLGGGVLVNLFFDIPGDFDLFTHHVNSSGNLVSGVSIAGLAPGFAYWLDFLGTSNSQLVSDVYAYEASGSFYVGQLLL